MATVRVSSSLVVLLLLISGVFISASSVVTPAVYSADLITSISPSSGFPPTGTSYPTGDLVTVAGTLGATSQYCTITATPVSPPPSGAFLSIVQISCYVSAGAISGSFYVGAGSTYGTYLVTVTGVTSGTSVTSVGPITFSVRPRIVLSPTLGPAGTSVSVTGSGFMRGSTSPSGLACIIGGSPIVSSPTCGQGYNGEVSGVFTVSGGWPPGGYLVTVYDYNPAGPSASATFTIITGPTLTFTPTLGPTGTLVTVGGSGWSTSDTFVTLDAGLTLPDGSSNLWNGPTTFTCPVSGGIIYSCSFTVKPIARGGLHGVTATGSAASDKATTSFTVTSTFIISPTIGGPGTAVFMTGSGYLDAMTDCKTIVTAFPTSPALFTTGANPSSCKIDNNYILTGQFTVASIPPAFYGPYTVTISDPAHVEQGPISQTFTVSVSTLTFTPSVGPTGTLVTVGGSGWSTSDTFVTLDAGTTLPDGSSNLWTGPTTFTCPVSGGIIGSCSFTVRSNALGGIHTVTATGAPFGDKTALQFIVQSTLVFTPTNLAPGAFGSISGSGYLQGANGVVCAALFSAILAIPPPTFSSSPALACTIDNNGVLTGTFTIDPAAPFGIHTVTISGALYVQQGSISVPLTVNNPLLSFTPSVGPTGTSVTVTGSGWSTSDTSVTLVDTVTLPDFGASLWDPPTTRTCTISAGSIASGCTFTVKSTALGGKHTVKAMGIPYGEIITADFIVQSTLILTPNNGPRGVSGTISGSGYLNAGTCGAGGLTLSNSPLPTIFSPAAACTINQYGVLTGTFTIDGTSTQSMPPPSYGAHTVTISGAAYVQQVSLSTTFTVNSPTITLSPAAGPIGTTVTVTGSTFSLNDKGCLIVPSAGFTISGGVCSVASGSVTGSFVVASGTPSPTGYQVTVNGFGATTPSGDPIDLATATFTMKPTVTLTPTSGHAGTNVLVTGSNFVTTPSPGDNGPCTISSTPTGLIQGPVCTISSGLMSGSFVVAPGSSGPYTVTVTGASGDSGSATFTGPLPATLVLDPISGSGGTAVTASGDNYLGTTCLLTSNPSGLFSSSSCSISAGTLTGGFNVVSGATPGSVYTISVTTNAGDSATASFAVTAGPPGTLTLTPTSGMPGTSVTGLATGFTTDTSCQLTAAPGAILSSPSCTITGAGNANVGFIVASGAPAGAATVLVVGNTGKAASGTFTVNPLPGRIFTLTPTSGRAATVVTITGANYVGTICSLTSSPTGLITSQTCSLSSGTLTGGFTVGSAATPGPYTVTVTTDISADTVSASFTVPGATLTLTPTQGAAGTAVTASGSNYAGTTCTLASSPGGLFISQVCAISAAGVLTGGFTVASGAGPGTYSVTATTPSESPSASYTVPPPTLALSPAIGAVGTAVSVSGTNFISAPCSLSSSPGGLVSSQNCLISNGILTGGFVVASGAIVGTYTVTATPDLPGAATAFATFSVTGGVRPSLNLSPGSGATGTAVSISGSGYLGTTCTLTSSGLFGSAACVISGGRLTGGFTVASGAAEGSYTVTVTSDVSSDATSAVFSVTKKTTPVCIIATATFGSEAAPAVQFLRNFRDGLVLHTNAGSAFMNVFNAWYYSFSPTVAGFISSHDPVRAPVKVILYPLLGILSVSTFVYSIFSWTPEFGVLMAGLIASSLIGLVYLTPFTLVGMRSLRRRKRINTISLARASLLVLAAGLGLLAAGELAGSFLILAVASSAIVLTCIIAAPTIVSLLVLRLKSQ